MDDDQKALDSTTTIRVGAATLTIVNVGDSLWTLAEELGLPEAERAAYPDLFAPRPFAGQCVHIAVPGSPGASVLVDASVYDFAPESPQVPPGYTPPPGLLATLAAHGIAAADVSHVVITHPHFDHINGLTQPNVGGTQGRGAGDGEREGREEDAKAAKEESGAAASTAGTADATGAEGARHAPLRYRPCFPHARHYLGARDWEWPEMRAALADPESLEARTLGVLHAAGLLELVAGAHEREIVPGVRIVPAPGETPGHQVVRVESEGQVAYCLGDLFHSAVEVARPKWMATWADRAAMAASRRALLAAALAEDALLVAAHIPGVGRLVAVSGADTSVRWQPVG